MYVTKVTAVAVISVPVWPMCAVQGDEIVSQVSRGAQEDSDSDSLPEDDQEDSDVVRTVSILHGCVCQRKSGF